MLTGIRVTIIGGDARQLEVIRRLSELDATVQMIGFDNWECRLSGVRKAELTPAAVAASDAILLPAVGTDDAGRIESVFSASSLVFTEELAASLSADVQIFTGMAKPYLRDLCKRHSLALTELFDRDDVAILNSIPTAEGAVMIAVQNTDFTIHGSRSLVLGFGRTGFTMARVLQGLGARVAVMVRKPEHFARASEMGFHAFYPDSLAEEAMSADLVFNTVPSLVLTAKVIAKLPAHAFVLDLASKPGGTDFRYAEKRGIKAMLAPGLPGIVAPKTAGKIIGETLSQLLSQTLDNGRSPT
ncbi:dipicolinate synthase subunit DpsA [Gorillibacterium sp. sgz500922]|uniref:dipicolinate synthase subunit DpsA n=1 Tax=Gorillibacterium sp. sgz500922 TaxID=3446694 RepID=UPI003F67636C